MNIPFLWCRKQKTGLLAVRIDEGYPEITRCTVREYASILVGISADGMY